MADANYAQIADTFVEYYYNLFDTDRSSLANLYAENSMLTFESSQSGGVAAIIEKLKSLPFEKVKHQTSTKDSQPTVNGGIMVLVTGQLMVDEEQRPMNYTQTFQLMPTGNGQYYVLNDIFKLVYG